MSLISFSKPAFAILRGAVLVCMLTNDKRNFFLRQERAMKRSGFLLAVMIVLGAIVVACAPEPEVVEKIVEVEKEVTVEVVREVETTASGWEVWLSDQSDSADIGTDNPAGTYGSRIIIYESSDILAAPPGWYAEDDPEYGPTVIEATDVFPAALEELGLNLRRLHGMLMHPPTHRYVSVNFFGPGAGLVGIIDAEGQCEELANGLRECRPIQGDPEEAAKLGKALFRTTGPEGSPPSNHMSFFSADGTKLIVANLGAKLLERIDYDAETDTFAFNKAATLDLVGGRDLTAMEAEADSTLPGGRVSGEYANFQPTTTPSGALKEGPGRANNVVVCPIISSNNQHAYVTFGGGGLFIVDITTEPMSIVAEYTNDVISVAGCGGAEVGGFLYLNAGVSAAARAQMIRRLSCIVCPGLSRWREPAHDAQCAAGGDVLRREDAGHHRRGGPGGTPGCARNDYLGQRTVSVSIRPNPEQRGSVRSWQGHQRSRRNAGRPGSGARRHSGPHRLGTLRRRGVALCRHE